jgi:hypothetical protein
VLLQEHHRLRRALQCPPLLDAALQGARAAVPLLIREGSLQQQQLGLGFQLWRPLQHGHQDAVPDLSQGISAGTQVPALLLLLPFRLQIAPIDPLGAAHRNPHRISRHLLAEPISPLAM